MNDQIENINQEGADELGIQPARRGIPKQAFIFTGVGIVLLGAVITAVLLFLNSPVKVEEAYEFAAEYDGILLEPGETAQIYPELTPLTEKLEFRAREDFAQKSFEYTSADDAVVTVDESGLVTAVAPGETTVSVRFSEFSESFSVRVYIPVTNVRLNITDLYLDIGGHQTLFPIVEPYNTTELPETPVYTSSDESVASVDADGRVTAVEPGEAVITMKSGEYTQSVTAHVTAHLKGVEITGAQEELVLDNSFTFSVKPVPANTTDKYETVYTSSDESVLKVNKKGKVTAVGPGTAKITVKTGRFFKYYDVFVRVPLTGVVMNYGPFQLRNGESVQLPYSLEPMNTNDEIEISWTSDDIGILSVDQQGLVTAVGPGTANVTVHANEFSASCPITVIIPVTGVAISADAMTLNKGQQSQLAASLIPANTTEERYIYWASDNISVATVDENGVVTAVGPGTAMITAYHDAAAASCFVTVLSPMTAIAFTQSSLSIIETTSAQLSVVYMPDDTTDPRELIFESTDPSVAVVDWDGVVTGVSVGSCQIIAHCGTLAAAAEITVTEIIEVESVILDRSSIDFAAAWETAQLNASLVPADATNAAIVWSSSNTNVAVVDGNGFVTAVGGGNAVISATAGGKKASCRVRVAAANMVVVLDPGHSATFTGASYHGYMEHIINLKVAQACKSYLESHYAGVTVYMTRYDHSPVGGPTLGDDLAARAQIAQDYKADIMVSLHFNASDSHSASGCLAFVSHQANVASQCQALANSILAQISALGITNLGPVVTESNQVFDEYGNPLDYYAINRHCANRGIPGIIVEHCFMDSQPEYISSDESLAAFGAADAIGIANYLGLSPK